uniref:GB1/RHD3-type G domain-containing protein n=1 Tax=Myotis myotis TaxID=51298 RepID=A0A7J7ZXJ7_MYOMY|nr:hypothetical protein mMyoMyo1_009725 [Myotis myotis]
MVPEDGTVNLETWTKVEEQLKNYYSYHGSVKVLANIFSLWNSICDTLAPEAKTVELSQTLNSPSTPPKEDTSLLSPAQSKSNVAMPTDQKENKYHKHDHWSFPVSREERGPPIQNRLPKLERKPKPGPAVPMSSMSKFQRVIREAEANGDLEFSLCFPVAYENEFGEDENPTWEPIPYKTLKELKLACSEYGPLAPYTQTLVEILASKWMTPYDWSQVCKACLSGGDYLLWKTEYDDLAKRAVATSKNSRGGITLDMILGEGDFNTAQEQMYMPKEALIKVTSCAVNAWKSLPYTAGETTTLTEVKQKVEEPYQDFLSRLMQAVKSVINNQEPADILINQLAFENANNTCQALLRPIRRTGTINDFIKQCADGDSKNDSWIFALAVLLSSMFVYNSMSTINHQALEQLHYVTELTKLIRAKSSPSWAEVDDSAEFVSFFPGFVWVLRDFMLELMLDRRTLTEDEYLENAVKLLADAKTKSLREGIIVTGNRLGTLAKAYVDAINSGAVPCLENAVITLAECVNSVAVQKAADHYSQQMAQRVNFPTDTLQELLGLHTACEKEAIAIFIEHSFKNDKWEFQKKCMGIIEKKKEDFLLKNEEESLKYCQAQLRQLSEPLMEGISKGTFSVPGGYILYSEEMNKVERSYALVPGKGVKVRNKKMGEDQHMKDRVFVGSFGKSMMIGLYVK